MSRRIAVKDSEGNDDYVIAAFTPVQHSPLSGHRANMPGSVSFYLSTGEELNLESAHRFEDPISEQSYYVLNEEDLELLLRL
ncbi:MAG: hypothetical protein ACQEUG_16070 [Pseudomonadota bacterium]